MKQLETTHKTIGEHEFYIKPFSAFTSANICGDLAKIITPILAGIFADPKNKNKNLEDVEIDSVMPTLNDSFNGLSGDVLESTLKKLLIVHKNISVEGELTNGNCMVLSEDLANEIFCGELQDMFVLCFEVIKLNFGGFFKKLGAQYGSLTEVTQEETQESTNGESLT